MASYGKNNPAPLSNTVKTVLSFLFVLVIASLALNGFLLWQWLGFLQRAQVMGQQAQVAVDQAVAGLSDFENATIQFSVPVHDEIPVKTTVKFQKTVEVPINMSIPIDQQIKTQIPLKINDITIPIEVNVPVKMNIPINDTQKVKLDLDIPIETSVPIDMNIPVNIPLKDTGLTPYIEQLRGMLQQMNESFSSQLP